MRLLFGEVALLSYARFRQVAGCRLQQGVPGKWPQRNAEERLERVSYIYRHDHEQMLSNDGHYSGWVFDAKN